MVILRFFSLVGLLAFGAAFMVASEKQKTIKLPKILSEISGHIWLNDTLMLAHNDSGDDAVLYLLNNRAELKEKIQIKDAKNIDFEDMTSDGKFVYVGDIGNNLNARKELFIYRISIKEVLTNKLVEADKITFYYPEQKDFPAKPADRYYDAEALMAFKDSLVVVTKCRTEPFDGKAYYYSIPKKPGRYAAKRGGYINVGKRGLFQDAVTGAACRGDEWYLLTYNRLMIFKVEEGKPTYMQHISLLPISQKESVAILSSDNKQFTVADEVQKFIGGGKLYHISRPEPKKKKK